MLIQIDKFCFLSKNTNHKTIRLAFFVLKLLQNYSIAEVQFLKMKLVLVQNDITAIEYAVDQ
jgi:hypothetical protein